MDVTERSWQSNFFFSSFSYSSRIFVFPSHQQDPIIIYTWAFVCVCVWRVDVLDWLIIIAWWTSSPFSRSPHESMFFYNPSPPRPSQLTSLSSSALIDRALDCMFHPLFFSLKEVSSSLLLLLLLIVFLFSSSGSGFGGWARPIIRMFSDDDDYDEITGYLRIWMGRFFHLSLNSRDSTVAFKRDG